MRIISGKYRGRTIKAPNPKFTRPTTDMVKETMFNILQNRLTFEGAKVLDIYAGSGSLGLEALSRGAEEVHFVEQNFSVFKTLSGNIQNLDASEDCKIIKRNALKFSKAETHLTYDIVFADPPFFKSDIYEVSKNIIERGFLNNSGIFIIERSIQTKVNDIESLGLEPFKKIGDTLLYWYDKN